jgi:hypothetical protein
VRYELNIYYNSENSKTKKPKKRCIFNWEAFDRHVFLLSLSRNDETANGALRDAAHRLHQVVLYCRNFTLLYGICVPVTVRMCLNRSTALPAGVFTKPTNALQLAVNISGTEFHANSKKFSHRP